MSGNKEIVYTWFAEPKGDQTNKVIANMIDACDNESHILEGVICEDGQPHNLWELRDFHMVGELNASRKNLQLRFDIWVREGNGLIRRWFKSAPKKAGIKKETDPKSQTAPQVAH